MDIEVLFGEVQGVAVESLCVFDWPIPLKKAGRRQKSESVNVKQACISCLYRLLQQHPQIKYAGERGPGSYCLNCCLCASFLSLHKSVRTVPGSSQVGYIVLAS